MATMQSQVSIHTDAIDVKSIRSLELADGWHEVTACELVQFAVGEAHSPIMPTKLYPVAPSPERERQDGAHPAQQDPELL